MNHADFLGGYPKEVVLLDGTGVTLRPIARGDARALFEMFQRLSDDDLWFLNHDVSDARVIAQWADNPDTGRVISLAAFLEGTIIGNGVLMRKRYGAKSHVGTIRICVAPLYRERRLATWMLLDLVNLAMVLGLKTLTMRLVRDRDARIISAVKRLDFVERAVLDGYVLDRNGTPLDLVIMTKRLYLGWDTVSYGHDDPHPV